MRALSVGILSYSTKPRGSVVHAACLAEALQARGHDTTLYALDKDGEGFFRRVRCSLALIPAAKAPAATEALVAQRIEEVAAHLARRPPQHDVLLAEDCLVASGLLTGRAHCGGALLGRTIHHVERFESPYLERCQSRSIREADLCLSVSRATRADVLNVYGRDSTLVGNGVDFARFHETPRTAGKVLRSALGVPSDAPLVVSIGGVEERKNSLLMLEAFLLARHQLPTLRWVIAGGASIFEHAAYRSAFEARLAMLAPDQRASIQRLGVLEEARLAALLSAADVLLHASLHEGFGLCVLEAMAAGAKVVVSRGLPFDEFVDDTCSVRVDPEQPANIARGIVEALRYDPQLVDTARARARSYSWERCAERHEESFFAALAGQAGAPLQGRERHA